MAPAKGATQSPSQDTDTENSTEQIPDLFKGMVGSANSVPKVRRGRQKSAPKPEVLWVRDQLEKMVQNPDTSEVLTFQNVTKDDREKFAKFVRDAGALSGTIVGHNYGEKIEVATRFDEGAGILYWGTQVLVDKLAKQSAA